MSTSDPIEDQRLYGPIPVPCEVELRHVSEQRDALRAELERLSLINKSLNQTVIDQKWFLVRIREDNAQLTTALDTANAQIESLSLSVKMRTQERDDAIKEASRRDQKWMDGINEAVGMKLDYGDPCSSNNASKALGELTERLREAEAWIPIHTAPRDGTRILICSGDGALLEVARWARERWMSAPGNYNRNPTYWKPIGPFTPPDTT